MFLGIVPCNDPCPCIALDVVLYTLSQDVVLRKSECSVLQVRRARSLERYARKPACIKEHIRIKENKVYSRGSGTMIHQNAMSGHWNGTLTNRMQVDMPNIRAVMQYHHIA